MSEGEGFGGWQGMETSEVRTKSHSAVYCAVAMAVVACGFYVFQFGWVPSVNHTRWGEFGDYLGGVLNPGLALIAIVILLRTLHLQRTEFQLQRIALAEQAKSLRVQNFERAFFEMIRLHHNIVNDLELRKDGDVTVSGRDCFRTFCVRFDNCLKAKQASSPLERIELAYDDFHKDNQSKVGHYFRNLYRIMKFVDEADVTRKKRYTGILRAQLSSYELSLMFHGTLHRVGKKLRPLVEKYSMFDNVDRDFLSKVHPEVLNAFRLRAYGDQCKIVAEYIRAAGLPLLSPAGASDDGQEDG